MALNKILLAVDDSSHARKAAGLVMEMSQCNSKLSVTILHVLAPIPAIIGNPQRTELIKDMEEEAKQLLKPYKEMLDNSGIRCITRIEQGKASAGVLKVAEEDKCDLIIMGAHGQSSLEDMLLGSVSHKVLQYAKIPVLIVH